MKIVIGPNVCGFMLSPEAIKELIFRGCPFIRKHKKDYTENDYAVDIGDGFKKSEHMFFCGLIDENYFYEYDDLDPKSRCCSILISLIEEKGVEFCSIDGREIKIVEIPDDVDFIICAGECGSEWIAEKHRTWY